MSQIDAPEDPYPVEKKLRKHCNAMDDESSMRILARADPGKQVISWNEVKLWIFKSNNQFSQL